MDRMFRHPVRVYSRGEDGCLWIDTFPCWRHAKAWARGFGDFWTSVKIRRA